MMTNRKTATKLLLVQWSRFQKLCVKLEGSTLFTGVNGSGKSTILDAMTYLLTGNTQFNKAAKDRDRTVLAYVRGDTRSNGPSRYLRSGEVVSYIAMEFWSPIENEFLVAGVCIESANEAVQPKGSWFVCRNAKIDQMNFIRIEGKSLRICPRNELGVNGHTMKSADFFGRDRGVEQVLRALGLRCNVAKYRSKLVKMMAFNPENNIDQFIQECVLEPGKVESLKELREQRQRFEQIKGVYENLKASKIKLEEVEQKIEEYENKLRSYQIRDLMLCYQGLREKEEREKETKRQIQAFEQKISILQEQKEDYDKRCADAEERYRIAMNNDAFKGMQETLNELKRQKEKQEEEIKKQEERLAKLKRLQIQVTDNLEWLEQYLSFSEDDKKCLFHLAESGFSTDRKLEAFVKFAETVEKQMEVFEEEYVHLSDTIKKVNQRMEELEEKIKRLQANIMVFPKETERARQIIQEELERKEIHTEVKIFAELVQEILDPEWRAAIETFLGRKRFYLIVDGKYCHEALEILQRRKIHDANVVVTDKLPDVGETPGSAAEILTIPNIYARRYANYLLNGIHLCDSLRELHNYPKGGLMRNGMLAKGYTVAYMNIEKTDFCLGQDAIKCQLQKAASEKQDLLKERQSFQKQKDHIYKRRVALKQIDWRTENYHFNAAAALESAEEQKKRISDNIEKISKAPDFMTVLQEQENAEREMKKLRDARDVLIGDIKGCEKDEQAGLDILKSLSGEIDVAKQEYSAKCIKHLELKAPMLKEYERQRAKRDAWLVITEKTVRNLKGEVEDCARVMETAQLEYCKLAEIDINKRGVPYIPFFRKEYKDIANIKIEDARQRLEEQSAKLESAFMNDFVAEMNETIRDAKEEITAINRELKQLPFGSDTYKFVMKEKPDREIFFRICRKLENYMDTPEVYMNSAREDEEMERDIQEFMGIILDEEDESEYTDYRKYFVYDMEIVSKQGENEIVSDLSKKQGSASNGEKQTPYFIILAASLLQCYPRQTCCARLAFIDEAFSALSRERIEQMVKYLSDNHFQVFYAAPPEKISSIGTHIESTISLVMTGRYTNAVEGLVKDHEETA